jgi:hypothetical protein
VSRHADFPRFLAFSRGGRTLARRGEVCGRRRRDRSAAGMLCSFPMRRSALLIPAFAFSAALWPSPAGATVMVPLTVEDMAVQSACVVHGRVVQSRAAWDEGHQRIFTFTDIEILDALHAPSALPKTITVRTLGGEVEKIGMRVSGTEKFAPQEEVVVFLRRDPVDAQAFQTVGMSQGKYSVEHEAKGRAVAVPSLEGLAFARPDPNGGSMKVSGEAPDAARIPLNELRERVQAAIASRVPSTPSSGDVSAPKVPAQPQTPATPIAR